jgi:molybdopterin-containing oxidoreductase family membrane subunit
MDFAAAQLPGWHSTIFPPYFVAGAIFSGFAMVLTLAIPLRWAYGLQDFITIRHLENCAKLMLVTGLVVAYGYAAEAFYGWLSGNEFDMYMNVNRGLGNYRVTYGVLIFCNVISPQFLWFQFVRRSVFLLFILSLIIQLGMWMERFVIIVTSLQRDFLPSSWGMYYPTLWDYATLFGTVGFFALCFLIFVRILPAISISEMRELVHKEAA